MIRLLIIGLLAFIGYAPCSLAYSVVYAPPVEKHTKKKASSRRIKKKRIQRERMQNKKMKTSTLLFFLSTLCSLVSLMATIFSLTLGASLIGSVFTIGFLALAVLFLIFGFVEKGKEKSGGDGSGGLGGKDKNTSGNLGD
ncbi:hypothetical protein [Aureispira sp. CCB-QB1]|uniref:hypothetical protein n=1 Tax=Aureispira sp. CCB-QB1 TaxID=1313421 RepID=UPI000696DEF1|nr:hypothetical protein [Aureispira sp. CCB-QB1]